MDDQEKRFLSDLNREFEEQRWRQAVIDDLKMLYQKIFDLGTFVLVLGFTLLMIIGLVWRVCYIK